LFSITSWASTIAWVEDLATEKSKKNYILE